jgi:hypothetical protein
MVKVREDMTGWVMSEHEVPDSLLTVIERVEDYIQPSGVHRARYLCQCKCGSNTIARGDSIKDGSIKSCGCLQIKATIEMGHKNKKYNKYDLRGRYCIGWTTNTNREFYFDLEDYDKIKDCCWCESISCGTSRLATGSMSETIFMHQLLGFANHDHINRNGLDNRKKNFRPCTTQENTTNRSLTSRNTSGFIGVCWREKEQRWIAQIMVNYKGIYLGCFADKNDAIRARLNAEVKYFGLEFSPQRHLFEQYGINTKQNDLKES